MNLDIPSYRSKAILEASTLPFGDVSSTSNKSTQNEDPIASQIWKMYTKQRDALPNGARMENLSWRMVCDFHLSMYFLIQLDGHEFEAQGSRSSTTVTRHRRRPIKQQRCIERGSIVDSFPWRDEGDSYQRHVAPEAVSSTACFHAGFHGQQ